MYEMVRGRDVPVWRDHRNRGGDCSIQVYEETEGIGPGQPVFRTGEALSVELGPGLIRSIYDGVQRPLNDLNAKFGDFIVRGAESPALSRETQWTFEPAAKTGDKVASGDLLGTVQESKLAVHKIMVPAGGGQDHAHRAGHRQCRHAGRRDRDRQRPC